MKYGIFILLCTFCAFSAQARDAQVLSIVNNEIISSIDVEDRLKLILATSGKQISNEDIEKKLLPEILQNLVDERLYVQEAGRLNLKVKDEELDKAFETISKQNGMEKEQLEAFLEKQGVPKASLLEQLRNQILWSKIVAQKIRPRVSVSDTEIKEAAEHMKTEAGVTEVMISEIALPIPTPTDEPKVKKLAYDLIEQISSGKISFEEAATRYSRSKTALDGGRVGWVQENRMSPAVAQRLQTMQNNQIAEPLHMNNGYYIVKLQDRRQALAPAVAETNIALQQAFIPGTDKAMIKTSAEKLSTLRQHIASCGQFKQAAATYAPDATIDQLVVKLKDVHPDIRDAVANLNAGQVSNIVVSSAGVHIFMVCKRDTPVNAVAEAPLAKDENATREFLMQKKIKLQAQHYLRDLRRQALIEWRNDEPAAASDATPAQAIPATPGA